MAKRFLPTLICVASIVGTAGAQVRSSYFPDIPDNHWAYEAEAQFVRSGLVAPWRPGIFYSGPPWRRADVAARIEFCFDKLVVLTGETAHDITALSAPVPAAYQADTMRDLAKHLEVARHASSWREPMHRLLNEFAPDLVALSLNVEDMRRKLDAAITECERSKMPVLGSSIVQFADVPSGHWAAQATLDLRQAGILVGYPDGKFRG